MKKQRIYFYFRIFLALIAPFLIWSYFYVNSYRTVIFLEEEISTSTPPGYGKNISIDFNPLASKEFLYTALNIPFTFFEHKLCLSNNNQLSIRLGNHVFDPRTLPLENKENIGAMNVRLTFDDESFIDIYSKIGSSTCKILSAEKIAHAKLSAEFDEVIFKNIVHESSNPPEKYPNATSTIDSHSSRMNIHLTLESAIWMGIFTFFGWNTALLLLIAIYKFIYKGPEV